MIWLATLSTTAATWLMKAAGPLVFGSRKLPPRVRSVTALAAPALIAGLVLVELGGPGWSQLSWSTVSGAAVAAGAYLLRVPMLLAVVVGMVTAALLRLYLAG